MTKTPIRLIIVDDSRFIRELFSGLLEDEPGIEVVGVAEDPYDAREKIKRLNPDVITLDVEMPKMDGISFLEKIMTLRPMPVVMASTLTKRGADTTLRALELGAVDFITKPTDITEQDFPLLKSQLITKIKAAAQAAVTAGRVHTPAAAPEAPAKPARAPCHRLIAIGASTGGVEAIRHVMGALPRHCPPVVITQHMPAAFTASFAHRLNDLGTLKVKEAADGDTLQRGHAYVAPGGLHLQIKPKGAGFLCRVGDGELVSGHKPSVDVMFASVAEAAGPDAVGVILTGMGRDGASGLLKMRQAGARTFGQDPASCVVYGMPKVAFETGGVEKQIPLARMAQAILDAEK